MRSLPPSPPPMVAAMDDAEKIAAGLTEAQRRAMLSAHWIYPGGQPAICVVAFTDPWPAPVAQFFTLATDRLTPLGLAVKAILERPRT
jgi:hypothetical protein